LEVILQLNYDIPVARYEEKWKITELVIRSDKECKEIYKELWLMLKNEKLHRISNREANNK